MVDSMLSMVWEFFSRWKALEVPQIDDGFLDAGLVDVNSFEVLSMRNLYGETPQWLTDAMDTGEIGKAILLGGQG
jgi:hypothetical protein